MLGQTCALAIGESYLSVLDADADKKNLRIHSAGFTDLPFNPYAVMAKEYAQKASDALHKLVADSGIKKTDVHIVVPDSQSYTRVLDMPFLSDKELLSAIRYQADQFIPVPINQVALDIHVITKDKKTNKTVVMLVASTHTVVNHVVKLVEGAALVPARLENEASAFLRLVTTLRDFARIDKPLNQLYINLGSTSSSLYLFDAMRNIPVLVHSFSIGQNIFFKNLKANFMLTDEQVKDIVQRVGFTQSDPQYKLGDVFSSAISEYATEIKRFLMSAQEQKGLDVHEAFIVGEGTQFAGIDKVLTAQLGKPVSMFSLAASVGQNTVTDFFKDDWPLLAPAVGGCL